MLNRRRLQELFSPKPPKPKPKRGRPRKKPPVKNPDLGKIEVEWLVASVTSTGIIRMFGIWVNRMTWIYFSLDPNSEPTSRQDFWKRIEWGGDDDMKRLMYTILIFAEDPESERFAREVLGILEGEEANG